MRTARIDLGGAWEFSCSDVDGPEQWLPGRVPGTVQGDLMAAGRLEDFAVATNEDKVQWVSAAKWAYRRRFDAPALPKGARAILVFEGLDTFATILLNGRPVGTANNMFMPWRFDVTESLAAGENELVVMFDSTEARARAAAEAYGVKLPSPGTSPNGVFVRKAPCHFGWDWGPTVLAVGIWRPVRLEIAARAFIDAIDAWGDPGPGDGGRLRLAVEVAGPDAEGLALAVTACALRGRTNVGAAEAPIVGGRASVEIPVEKAELWWPNGLGAQPLYRLRVRLMAGRQIVDERMVRVGIRCLELVREDDVYGRSFALRANGQTFFAKGANWIPADSLPPRVTPQRYRDLVDSCADAGMNMLRVWGGGYYEDEAFYDRCDERGILIWQDFMFACGMYPGDDPAYAESVRAEAEEAIKRLRNHTCMALWCGNNEMESGWFEWGWSKTYPERVWHAYERIFHDILPKAVAALDPRRPYVPSSPHSTGVGCPNDASSGDCHYWQVWHGQGSHFDYLKSTHRFVSEFGFQSLPALATLSAVIPPEERRLDSPSMLKHQKCASGNDKIARAVETWLGRPRDFESLIYLSQVYQALAVRTGVEHWRRSAPRTMGALYWQANDCWPVASWASLDYYGRWKALHYAARRFFAPYLVSGLVDQESARIWATADFGAAPVEVQVRWHVWTWDGRLLHISDRTFPLAGGETVEATKVMLEGLAGFAPASAYVAAELLVDRKAVSRTILAPVPLAQVALPDPKVRTKVRKARGGAVVEVVAESVALAAGLEADGVAGRFEDNFFDLLPGEKREVKFLAPDRLDKSAVERLAATLRVRTVYDARLG
jgi:beta-mannosidase